MNLNMYAYSVEHKTQNPEITKNHNDNLLEFYYWRNYKFLHCWMERLWELKKFGDYNGLRTKDFNGVLIKLNAGDLDKLENDVKRGKIKECPNDELYCFFGNEFYEELKYHTLEFIKSARNYINNNLDVYYKGFAQI